MRAQALGSGCCLYIYIHRLYAMGFMVNVELIATVSINARVRAIVCWGHGQLGRELGVGCVFGQLYGSVTISRVRTRVRNRGEVWEEGISSPA